MYILYSVLPLAFRCCHCSKEPGTVLLWVSAFFLVTIYSNIFPIPKFVVTVRHDGPAIKHRRFWFTDANRKSLFQIYCLKKQCERKTEPLLTSVTPGLTRQCMHIDHHAATDFCSMSVNQKHLGSSSSLLYFNTYCTPCRIQTVPTSSATFISSHLCNVFLVYSQSCSFYE